jgi:two-component system, NarL family, nitrate/nitrite response regulator NarL
MTTLLLYCTQPILAAGLRSIMERLTQFQAIEFCSNAESLKDQARALRPDVLLVEVTPSITLDFLEELTPVARGAHVVLWMDGASSEFLVQALNIGVRGLLRKDQSVDAIRQCLGSVAAGELWLDQELAGRLLSRKVVHISTRERQLVGLLTQGLKNKEIAYAMGITEGTVKVYLSRIFAKVGAKDRFDLALMGLKNIEGNQQNAFDRVAAKSADRAVPFTIPPFLSTRRTPTAA